MCQNMKRIWPIFQDLKLGDFFKVTYLDELISYKLHIYVKVMPINVTLDWSQSELVEVEADDLADVVVW